jgi:hypothetical protein
MTTPVSARIGEIAKRCEAATEGPWKSRKSVHGKRYRYVEIDKSDEYTTCEMKPCDSDFIAHAREDIPYLLSLVAQYQQARAIVDEQAADGGLWFIPQTAAEAYLMQELRKLHAAIEGKSPDECAAAILAQTTPQETSNG